MLGIYGRADEPELVARSDDVCTGLQLVNFLQDPPRDLALGRVYLPQEDLRQLRRRRRRPRRARGASGSRRSFASRPPGPGRSSSAGFGLADALGGRAGRSVALFARGGLAALDALERARWDVCDERVPRPAG